MNTKKPVLKLIIVSVLLLQLNACKEEGPRPSDPPKNETELITTVVLEFEDSILLTKSYAVFRDIDGPGGNGPSQFDTIKLATNRTYLSRIYLLDESKTPADTISNEVRKEANDHLFVFEPYVLNIQVKVQDKDDNNLPLGLFTLWKTGNMSNGKMKIMLKHQPGLKDGTATPGETDIEVSFNCLIK